MTHAQTNLTETFTNAVDVSDHNFPAKNEKQRIQWAHEKFGEGLALTSSFGVQSILMIQAIQDAGLINDIPVIRIDLPNQTEEMREYSEKLQKHFGFKLLTVQAKDDADKDVQLKQFMKDNGITATLSGVRHDQTENRAGLDYIAVKPDNSTSIHPILDWPQAKADFYIEKLPTELHHPQYAPGVQSHGGQVLENGAEKTECGLHL